MGRPMSLHGPPFALVLAALLLPTFPLLPLHPPAVGTYPFATVPARSAGQVANGSKIASTSTAADLPFARDLVAGVSPWLHGTRPKPSSGAPSVANSSPDFTVPTGYEPDGAAYDSKNGYLYIANGGERSVNTSNVTVVNGKSVVATVPIKWQARSLVYDSRNGYIYVADAAYPGNVTVINGTSVIARIGVGIGPANPVYDSENGYVYVPDTNGNSTNLSVINGTKVLSTVTVAAGPYYALYDDQNGWVYVLSGGAFPAGPAKVDVINGTVVIGSIAVGVSPTFASLDSANGFIYISNENSANVSVINGTRLVGTVVEGVVGQMGPLDSAFDPEDGYVYVANWGSHNVSVINGTRLVGSIPEDAGGGVTYLSANGYVYLVGSNVNVYRGLQWIGTTHVGVNATAPVYDSGNNHLYIVNEGSNNVSALFAGYRLNFTETGLPAGTDWSVNLNGSVESSNRSGLPSFVEFNGTYAYSAPSVSGYTPLSTPGTATINGSSRTVDIVFAKVYPVTFQESGLPPGTRWWVNVTSQPSYNSSGTAFSVSLPNGSYPFTVADSDPTYSATGGSFQVRGGAIVEPVLFTRVTYSVTFTEAGLPMGTNWSVTLGGALHSGMGSTISGAEPNGSYAYRFGEVPGWTPIPVAGTLVVNGSAVLRSVNWTLTTYTILIVESGLPLSTPWWLNLTGGPSRAVSGSSLSLLEPNGSYTFSVGTTNKSFFAPGGTFAVRGRGVAESVLFAPFTSQVTFAESGLPNGTEWTVQLDSQSGQRAAPGSITFEGLSNGSYSYSAAVGSSVGSFAANPPNGTLRMTGAPLMVTVTFHSLSVGSQTPPAGSTLLGMPEWGGLAVIGILLAAVAATAMILLARRIREKPPGPEDGAFLEEPDSEDQPPDS